MSHCNRRLVVLALICAASLAACADNATRLRFRIEREVAKLGLDGGDLEIAVPYEPVRDNQRPYWLIFKPDWQVGVSDLVAAGLDEDTAIRLFQEFAYVDFGDEGFRPNLVVVQDGRRLNFTGTWRPRAQRLLVARRQGQCEIILQRRAAEWYIVDIR